ncbi:MAG: hypothetical protein LBP62_01595 [Clostridiales bacterium]|jgi:hypothetical protein|nr:hypothetical protein [Clostridiales bacterium]
MKKKISLAIALMLLAVVSATMLTGCWWLFKEEDKGFEIGFVRDQYLLKRGITVAIKSDKSEFSVDDVTLEFFYGTEFPIFSQKDSRFIPLPSERYEQICIGVYLGYADVFSSFEDYRNIENFNLIKEISIEEFNSEAYSVTEKVIGFSSKFTFNHSEKLTVPESLFIEVRGTIKFFVGVVMFDTEEEKYVFFEGNYYKNAQEASVKYELLDDGRIRLYR